VALCWWPALLLASAAGSVYVSEVHNLACCAVASACRPQRMSVLAAVVCLYLPHRKTAEPSYNRLLQCLL
jgi:hypothetical protein